MADSPQQVIAFLRDLARARAPVRRARPGRAARIRRERAGHRRARRPGTWPTPAEKLKEERYAFSEQEVKQYFTEPKVLDGLFQHRRDAVRGDDPPRQRAGLAPERAVLPHRARRAAARTGRPVLPRPVRAHRQARRRLDGRRARPLAAPRRRRLQTPVAHLVCNFAAAASTASPALLTHDDVITLFHEFGHGLHHMLTQVDELGVSGISGVEWDAVELPSQFMENFCWEWDVLQAPDRARRHRRAAAARAVRQDGRGEELPERPGRRCARSSSRCSTCGCTPSRAAQADVQAAARRSARARSP